MGPLSEHRVARVFVRTLALATLLVSACNKGKAPVPLADAPKALPHGGEVAPPAKGKDSPLKGALDQPVKPSAAVQDAQAKAAEVKDSPAAKAPAKAKPAERPLYYDRLITPEDLKGRSLREFSLLRNTIFARVGNSFRKTWLDEHFRAQPWYKALEKAQLDRLTAIDKKNVEIIVQAQEALSKQELESARDTLAALKERSKEQDQELRLLSSRLGKWAGDEKLKDPKRTPLEDPTLLDKILKLSNLREMSRRDLRILRNMIYARRGRSFDSPLVSSYFHRMDWYEAVENFKSSMLTATDRKNIRIVKSLEHSLGGPIKDTDHPEDDWMYVA